jgi:NAD(P)-dependent dehydrogenase (short-subunit alcohol dehydrogenase family)
MAKNKNFWKYFKQYEVSQIMAMIKNGKKDPLICEERFENKLVVISGTTSGIGKFTAVKYASMGADLLCINRNEEKSIQLKTEIESTYATKCDYFIADLSKIKDIHETADKLSALERPIDVIIHNAGLTLSKQQKTEEGLDLVFVVNHLSSFIINYKLMGKLKAQSGARIIMNNSEGHRFAPWGLRLDDLNWKKRRYSGLKAYGSAKLAQLLSMHIFKEKLEGSNVLINAMHPGAVESNSGKDNGPLYKWYKRNVIDKVLRPTTIASDSLYYLGVSKNLEGVSGKFFCLTTEEIPAPPAWDINEARKLWELSLKLGNLKETEFAK